MSILGSEYIVVLLHALAQSLLIPVLVGLLAMALYVVVELGNFLAERQNRKKLGQFALDDCLSPLGKSDDAVHAVNSSQLSVRCKKRILELLAKRTPGARDIKVLMNDLLDCEEYHCNKVLQKTDMVTKLGPVLGLMGTLIPLGPGLAALGRGDIQGLSEAVIIAFDTTVIGISIGAVSSVISKIRRGWYQKDLQTLENFLELLEGRIADEKQEEKIGFGGSR